MNMDTNTQTRVVLYPIQAVIEKDNTPKSLMNSTMFTELYLNLSYRDWELKVIKMNQLIREDNKQSKKKIHFFEP